KHPVVLQHVEAHLPGDMAITVITVEEQLTGWYTRLRRAKKRENKASAYQDLTDAVRGLSGLPILSFTEPAIIRYEQLLNLKLNIGKKDLCIAAITLNYGGILVSRNLRDFQRVPGLSVEDWSV